MERVAKAVRGRPALQRRSARNSRINRGLFREAFGVRCVLASLLTNRPVERRPLIPRFRQQCPRFFHSCAPDLHHLFVVALIKTAVVAVLEILPQRFWI
jgi:hypothetical protein